ncbi:MAG: adenosylcobinamide-GDP ribazoletransferase [Salinisphaeraceae bacterium]|nr:adenosylcobinamide-GDP ribazoletransferase [Salinisphaeraceae bacterium]
MKDYFFAALMFYTRIPCPPDTPHNSEVLQRATLFFPLIGWIVGLCAALVLYLSLQVMGVFPALVLSTAATVLLTGAFHEDGFADACDGFGGGWKRDDILRIMKDSRIGVYGALGLLLMLLGKLGFLSELVQAPSQQGLFYLCALFVLGHTLSRYTAVCCIHFGRYAQADGMAKGKAKPMATQMSREDFYLASGLAAAPWLLWLIADFHWALLLLPGLIAGIAYAALRYTERWIEGYTGDCLGAVQQIAEVSIYLLLVICW